MYDSMTYRITLYLNIADIPVARAGGHCEHKTAADQEHAATDAMPRARGKIPGFLLRGPRAGTKHLVNTG